MNIATPGGPVMKPILKRFGIAGLVFFTIKGLAWVALATAGAAGLLAR